MRDARFVHDESGLILIINLAWLDKPASKRQDNAPESSQLPRLRIESSQPLSLAPSPRAPHRWRRRRSVADGQGLMQGEITLSTSRSPHAGSPLQMS